VWRLIKSIEFWTAVSSIAACLAAGFAGWSALETRRSAEEANKGTRASVWLQVLNEYGTPEMFAAMNELRRWQKERPNDFAVAFKTLLMKQRRTSQEERRVASLDLARRRVFHFFGKLKVLYEGGLIEKQFLQQEWTSNTYEFIADVLIPIEQAKTEALAEMGSITPQTRTASVQLIQETQQFYQRLSGR
jgi:hypothetical protein